MRPYHVPHENEDPDIKKIKKVKIKNQLYVFTYNRFVCFWLL